jgi:regulator of protease activity HflC (stomatin/prohibitin superfamily)
MTDFLRAIIFLAILIIIVILPNIKIVKEDEAHVVERFGKFHKLLKKKGIYFIIPLFDRVIEVISLSVQQKKFKVLLLESDDFVNEINLLIEYRIIDIKLFCYYKIDSLSAIIEEISDQIIIDYKNDLKDIDEYNNISMNYGIELLEIKKL